MVIGIVVLHTPPYQPLSELGFSLFELIKAFFSHAVFRTTVPMLTAISAYLLFRSTLPSKPVTLLKKKSHSILVPLILWNLPVALGIFLVQKYELTDHSFSTKLYPVEAVNWLNAITGLFMSPANYPLNFLRDLFALSLLGPLFGLFLKRAPYIGAAIVILVYTYNLDGSYVLRNSMYISFYLGALAATQSWDVTYLDRYAPLLLLIFSVFCAAIVIFDIENREPLRMLAPFLVWPAMALLSQSRIGRFINNYSSSSFLLFLAHGPLLLCCWLIYIKVMPSVPYPVFWLLAPLFIVVSCALLSPLMQRTLPKTSQILLGKRRGLQASSNSNSLVNTKECSQG